MSGVEDTEMVVWDVVLDKVSGLWLLGCSSTGGIG